MDAEYVPVPYVPLSVVNDPYEVVRPYSKPLLDMDAPPVSVMLPFSVAEV